MAEVKGYIDVRAFGDYNDPEFYQIENGFAVIDYGFKSEAYEDIANNLGGEGQAQAFLDMTDVQEHGRFQGDGYHIVF